MKLPMTYAEFFAKVFPGRSVFDRAEYDFVTNAVKWLGLRLAYLLYRTGASANQIDVVGIVITVASFCALATATEGYGILPLAGLFGLYLHVFLDFADGAVARATGSASNVGKHLDNLGGDLDRFLMFLILGLYAGSTQLLIANAAAAAIFVIFVPATVTALDDSALARFVARMYTGRFSLLGCRFMLAVLPLLMLLVAFFTSRLREVATAVSILYIAGAFLWLVVCLLMPRPVVER